MESLKQPRSSLDDSGEGSHTDDVDVSTSEQNFESLYRNRADIGSLVVVDEKSGKLGYAKRGWFGSDVPLSTANKVRKAVKQLLDDLNKYPEKFKVNGDQLLYVLKDRLSNAGKSVYSHEFLLFRKNLQYMLLPQLGELSRLPLKKGDKERELDLAIQQAKLVYMLGIPPEDNKGASRSVIVKWLDGTKIGIFKRKRNPTSFQRGIYNWAKRGFSLQTSHLSRASMARPRAEVAVYLLDKHLGLGLTCPSAIIELGGREGSFQLYENGMEEAKSIRQVLQGKSKDMLDKTEKLNFQLMTLLNFLSGDLDCHDENWLVRSEGDCTIKELRNIDSANCMLTSNPTEAFLTDIKQYPWREWEIAEFEYLDEAREVMRTLIDKEAKEILEIIDNEPSLAGFLNEAMCERFRERAKILHIMADIPEASPKMLGELRTDKQIADFFKEYGPKDEIEKGFVLVDKEEN